MDLIRIFTAKQVEPTLAARQSAGMKGATQFAIALVTAPELESARKLAKLALKARLIACANLIPNVESYYWWRGKMESSAEIVLVLKCHRERVKELEALILKHHTYETPEFIVLAIADGSEPYLQWLKSECPLE